MYSDIRSYFSVVRFAKVTPSISNADFVIKMKREYRERFRREWEVNDTKQVIFDEGMNGFCVKTVYPFMSLGEMKNLMDEMEIIPYNSQYDCTGQIFTGRIYGTRLFCANKTIIYHFLSFDV